MNWQSGWQHFTVAALTLALAGFGSPVSAIEVGQSSRPVNPQNQRSQNLNEFQQSQSTLARSEQCYEVTTPSGLYVREAPTAGSAAIGVVPYEQNLLVAGNRVGEFVPIAAPVQGYVQSGWLAPCLFTPQLINICPSPINEIEFLLQRDPGSGEAIVGSTNIEQSVILNRGNDGTWTAVADPLEGYVPFEYLTYCD